MLFCSFHFHEKCFDKRVRDTNRTIELKQCFIRRVLHCIEDITVCYRRPSVKSDSLLSLTVLVNSLTSLILL